MEGTRIRLKRELNGGHVMVRHAGEKVFMQMVYPL